MGEEEPVQVEDKETTIVYPPATVSILRNKKKSMAEVALDSVTPSTNPFFKPRSPGLNVEGILPEEFVNKVFIETTIMVLLKPKDFVSTEMKWAIAQVTDWFSNAQQDLVPSVSLILLPFVMTSKLEPEAMQNMKKLLNGMVNNVKKHVDQFCVNAAAVSKGNTYQMYLKI
jgi:hypothetical protein